MPDPSGGQNPFGELNQGTDLRNQSMQMRMMMNADRMAQSEMPRTRFAGGRGGMGGQPNILSAMMGNEPDYSQFTYNPELNAQARAAGVTPIDPSQVKTNAILPNSGFFANHPRLSGMLEGGLFGAAATRGSDTVGEGISNVASGLIEGRQARSNMLSRQFAQPFQAASVLENLQDRAALREDRIAQRGLHEMDIQQRRAEIEHYKREDAGAFARDTRPVPEVGGAWKFNQGSPGYSLDSSGKMQGTGPWALPEQKAGWNFEEGPGGKAARVNAAWTGQEANRPYFAQLGIEDPTNATPEQWAQVHNMRQRDAESTARAMSGARGQGAQDVQGNLTPAQKEQITTLRQQLGKVDSKEYSTQIRRQVRNEPAWKDKPLGEQQAETNRRLNEEKQSYQGRMDDIMKSSPNNKKIPTWNPSTQSLE